YFLDHRQSLSFLRKMLAPFLHPSSFQHLANVHAKIKICALRSLLIYQYLNRHFGGLPNVKKLFRFFRASIFFSQIQSAAFAVEIPLASAYSKTSINV